MKITNDFKKLAKKLKNVPLEDLKSHLPKNAPNSALKTLLRAKCYYDLKSFALVFFRSRNELGELEGHAKDPFNEMHLNFFKKFHPDEKNIRKCILASRGSAKTTLICLIYLLHRVCYGNDRFIMLLSSTQPLARTKSKAIHSEVHTNEKLKDVFDLKFASKRKTSTDAFVISSCYGECKIQSHGFYAEIRGIKHNESRPSLLILDDVVHGEEVFSEEQRIKMERHFNTDIIQTIQPGTNIIYIGTRIHDQDLGSILSRKPLWDTEIYPAFKSWPTNMELWKKWEDILTDPTKNKIEKEHLALEFYKKNKKEMLAGAKVLWPERETVLELMRQRLDVGKKEFDAEKQMVAFLTGDSLFETWIEFFPTEQDGDYGFYIPKYQKFIRYDESRFIKYYSFDPATGERKKSTKTKSLSNSARIISAYDTHTGNTYLLECFLDRKPQTKIIEEMCDLHTHHNFHKMFLEKNLFRDLHGSTIKLIQEEWNREHNVNINLPIVGIWNDVDKEQRIYSLEPHFAMGRLLVNKYINPKYLSEMTSYPNSDKNDALDATEILWQGLNEKGFRRVAV